MAEKFATEHYELVVEPDLVATVESLTRSLEEPFGDSSMLPTYYISRLARQHVTVVLSGDGGDELFAGYERYPLRLRSRAFDSLPAWAGGFYREHIHRKVPYGFPGRNRVYNALLPPEERYLEGISLRGFEREISLLGDDFRVSANGHSDPLNLFRKYLAEAPARAVDGDVGTAAEGDSRLVDLVRDVRRVDGAEADGEIAALGAGVEADPRGGAQLREGTA